MLQCKAPVYRLPFLPIRVREIFSYHLGKKWLIYISMYHQLSKSGYVGIWVTARIHSDAIPDMVANGGAWLFFPASFFLDFRQKYRALILKYINSLMRGKGAMQLHVGVVKRNPWYLMHY